MRHWAIAAMVCLLFAMQPALAGTVAGGQSAANLYKSGKYAEAVKAINIELKRNPSPQQAATLYYYLGCCYYQCKQAANAAVVYKQLISSYPNSPETEMARKMLIQIDPIGA